MTFRASVAAAVLIATAGLSAGVTFAAVRMTSHVAVVCPASYEAPTAAMRHFAQPPTELGGGKTW